MLKCFANLGTMKDALKTLPWLMKLQSNLVLGNKGHMTYLSILAWMISNYRLAGGDNRYDALFH